MNRGKKYVYRILSGERRSMSHCKLIYGVAHRCLGEPWSILVSAPEHNWRTSEFATSPFHMNLTPFLNRVIVTSRSMKVDPDSNCLCDNNWD
jgi:hypothetical protein